jgi:hypothetical protein
MDNTYSDFSSIILALIITSEARMAMLPYRLHPYTIYTDTDSLVVQKKIPGLKINNKNLGEFKLEAEVKKGIFIKKKTYGIETVTGDKYTVTSGIKKNLVPFDDLNYILDNNISKIYYTTKTNSNNLILSDNTISNTVSTRAKYINKVYNSKGI